MRMKIILRVAICVVALVGAGAGYYLLYEQPTARHDQELSSEIEERQRALADLERSTAGIDDISHKIKELQDAVQFFESKLPQEKDVESILAQVWKLAEANSLQAKTIKSGKTERTANYSDQSIELSLSGDFNGFYLFMQQLEKLPRLTRVTDMSLTKMTDHDGQMQASVTLSIFFEPSTSAHTQTAGAM